jgi:hypothetical protein
MIKNKISITMCDVSERVGWGDGGLQRNVHMTFLMDKIDMCMSHEASLKEDIYCLFFSIISAGHCCILLALCYCFIF